MSLIKSKLFPPTLAHYLGTLYSVSFSCCQLLSRLLPLGCFCFHPSSCPSSLSPNNPIRVPNLSARKLWRNILHACLPSISSSVVFTRPVLCTPIVQFCPIFPATIGQCLGGGPLVGPVHQFADMRSQISWCGGTESSVVVSSCGIRSCWQNGRVIYKEKSGIHSSICEKERYWQVVCPYTKLGVSQSRFVWLTFCLRMMVPVLAMRWGVEKKERKEAS